MASGARCVSGDGRAIRDRGEGQKMQSLACPPSPVLVPAEEPGRGPSIALRSVGAPDMPANFNSTDAPLTGLSGRRRGRRPDTSLNERDRLLRVAARQFLPGLPVREQARRLERALVDFEWGKWRRWRVLDRPPERFADRIEAVLFDVLKTHPWPPRFETIRKALMQ